MYVYQLTLPYTYNLYFSLIVYIHLYVCTSLQVHHRWYTSNSNIPIITASSPRVRRANLARSNLGLAGGVSVLWPRVRYSWIYCCLVYIVYAYHSNNNDRLSTLVVQESVALRTGVIGLHGEADHQRARSRTLCTLVSSTKYTTRF